jgi:flagellar biosynthesis protein FlhG
MNRARDGAASPRFIAVASGKGGVGKSLVAANVGIFLATLGKRVTVIDCHFGAPNLHLFAGVTRPLRSLHEALLNPAIRLEEVSVGTSIHNLRLIGATFEPHGMAEPTTAQLDRLISEARALPADYVILDLAAGMNSATLKLFLAADTPVLIASPDPTSIELTHRFVRAAFVARLQAKDLGGLVSAVDKSQRELESGIPSALEIYLKAAADKSLELTALQAEIIGFAPLLIVNSVRSKSDIEMGRALAVAARRRLGNPIGYLGHLEYDEAVWASIRRRRPLLVEHPETRIAKCLERVTRSLLATADVNSVATDNDVIPSDTHYELLDVAPTASFEDLRRANRRIRDIYGAESVVISGLYDPASLEAVHRRLDLAYTTLMDAGKRKEYDRALFPDGVPMPVPPLQQSPAPRILARQIGATHRTLGSGASASQDAARPPMPALSTEFSGPLLKQIRESMGVELREIADRSKVGMAYLQAMEDEAFDKLPAVVYVRGFIAEYARVIASAVGVEAPRIRESYLARYRAARSLAPDE